MKLHMAGVAALGLTSAAMGQVTVDYRIVERTGQTVVSPSDPTINLAVQVRVNSAGGNVGLANTAMAIVIQGEAESAGVLGRDRTTNSDGTYYSGIAGPAAGTFSGLAGQYSYYAGINPAFNGLINSSAAVWTQTPYQDIGLIDGVSTGAALLNTPGVDADGDGVPDTAVGAGGTLPASIMREYFGAGEYIDYYRFRYTVTDFSARTLRLRIVTTDPNPPVPFPTITTFTTLQSANGLWSVGPLITMSPDASWFTGLDIAVVPAPGAGAGMLMLGALMARGRRAR